MAILTTSTSLICRVVSVQDRASRMMMSMMTMISSSMLGAMLSRMTAVEYEIMEVTRGANARHFLAFVRRR